MMNISLTFSSAIALFTAMVILASIPSMSVLTVSTRTITHGLTHGIWTAMGIVSGDILFLIVAIYGLSIFAGINVFFSLIKYIGALYLLWLGLNLWKKTPVNQILVKSNEKSSFVASFFMGFVITTADLKAILFYLSFLPAFLDLSSVSLMDTFIIILITIVAVGGIKFIYAFFSYKTGSVLKKNNNFKYINYVAGTMMIAIAFFLLFKT
ncbi:LysE family translocator [Cyanobacterium sp. Dongsha4]|uniref:LysE family translocator n=1 Tax=Cyanobacterium sp. DS4 TaxID=2878255 RepID=UPI002E80945F|nr:LysE family translocator [Cyanobacterium sp. Dongsha4]WVL01904.1 LysE family translocator [Cyanobacterium sp. Dongsha4]